MSAESHLHTVLVVDDDPGALDGLVYYLQSRGLDAVGALGVQDALQRLRDGVQPCLVVPKPVHPSEAAEAVERYCHRRC